MAPLPEMKAPPVVEVVCGIKFPPLDLDPMLLGSYWASRASTFPKRSLKPAVVDSTEAFITSDFPPARAWLLSADEDIIVQVQSDRFYLNWRASKAQQYPRFRSNGSTEGIGSLLSKEFTAFSNFCESVLNERPAPFEADLTKVNVLAKGVHWTSAEDLVRMLPLLQSIADTKLSADPQFAIEVLDRRDWASVIKVHSGVETDGKRDVVRLEIRRRASLDGDTLDKTFDDLNNQLNESFENLIPRAEIIARFEGSEIQ